MRVIRDPNNLVYAGDTAQTISRGVGFRFKDIQTLFFDESKRRKEVGGEEAAIDVGMPEIHPLAKNYRTHQGM